MTENGLGHAWVIGIFAVLVIVAWTSAGIFMLYSALTGKGITKPGKDSPYDERVQYHLRGLVGLTLIISGLYLLYSTFSFLL